MTDSSEMSESEGTISNSQPSSEQRLVSAAFENTRKRPLETEAIVNQIGQNSDIVVDDKISKRRAKRIRRKLEKGEMTQQQDSCADPKFQQCQFLVVKKNRLCRQRAIKGCDYCGEHLMTSDQKDGDHARVPCPLDPSHSCYKHLLSAHLKKCNAREKALPPYLVKNINGEDVPLPQQKASVHSVSDEELTAMIARIEAIYKDHVSSVVPYEGGSHPLIAEELAKFKDCATVEKHLRQQGHLVQLLCDKELVDKDHVFVEFGAGRGQLATWIMRALGDNGVRDSAFVLVDRGSQRYKADNRFVEEWGPFIHRIRGDIRHLCLERLEPFAQHSGKVVGFCKHLCGVAIDLALRCVTNTVGQGKLPKGVVMAVCCHHRCEWRWYCGRSWLEGHEMTERDFQLMVSIAGWATCGTRSLPSNSRVTRKSEGLDAGGDTSNETEKPISSEAGQISAVKEDGALSATNVGESITNDEEEHKVETGSMTAAERDKGEMQHKCVDVDQERPGRYQAMGLSAEWRREIGYMVKAILDEGRLNYLRCKGMTSDRVNFIEQSYTPENFAIVATTSTLPQ